MERENQLHNKLSAPYTIIRSNLPEVIYHLIYSHLLQVSNLIFSKTSSEEIYHKYFI